jgi:tetratricopeptide (TPR) repeat protein
MSVAAALAGQASAALKLINAGNISGAERLLKEVLAADPQNARANALMSIVLLRLGKAQAAVQQADVAIGLAPTADAFCFKAMALNALRQYSRAIEAAEAGVQAAPAYGVASFTLGQALENAGRAPEAEAAFRRAIELAPASVNFRGGLGLFLLRKGDLSGAERVAADVDPSSDAEAALLLHGEIALRRGKLKEARDFALWALSRNATSPAALKLLVQTKAGRSLGLGLWWSGSMMLTTSPPWLRFTIVICLFAAWIAPLTPLFASYRSLNILVFVVLLYLSSCKKIFRRMLLNEMKTVTIRPNF